MTGAARIIDHLKRVAKEVEKRAIFSPGIGHCQKILDPLWVF